MLTIVTGHDKQDVPQFARLFKVGCAEFVISGKVDADVVGGSECTMWGWEVRSGWVGR